MVKRLGRMERLVLWFTKELADQGGSVTRRRVLASAFAAAPAGPCKPLTRAKKTSFHHAVRSLASKGLLRKAEWTGVLKITPSGRQRLDDLRYTSVNAGNDRDDVCRKITRNPARRTSVSRAGASATP